VHFGGFYEREEGGGFLVDKDKKTNSSQIKVVTFGLILQKEIHRDGSGQMSINSKNSGIPEPEVLLWVESWLEKMKGEAKKTITDSFAVWKTDKDNKTKK